MKFFILSSVMPSTIKVPAHIEHHCHPCQHHKLLAASLDDVVYQEYGCTHPNCLHVALKPFPRLWELNERVQDTKTGHRYIGRTPTVPAWCPLLSGNAKKPGDPVFVVEPPGNEVRQNPGKPA